LRVMSSASLVLPDSTAWQSVLNDIITPPYYLPQTLLNAINIL
jgi:hypothetical protein